MDFLTGSGARLKLRRISREILDDYSQTRPLPQPPTRKVTVWGGVEEEIECPDDPDYQIELSAYLLEVAYDQTTMLLPAIEILTDWQTDADFLEMVECDAAEFCERDWLMHRLTASEWREVVGEIFYLSTVTERGIDEASLVFNVSWNGKPVEAWRVRKLPAKHSALFEARNAAQWGGYKWGEFCALPGKEQSAIVAHKRINDRLDALIAQSREKGI